MFDLDLFYVRRFCFASPFPILCFMCVAGDALETCPLFVCLLPLFPKVVPLTRRSKVT